MKLISGSSNPQLAKKIARELKLDQADIEIKKFSNGEKVVWVKDDLQGQSVVVVQSFVNPVDEMIVETLLIIDALERLGVEQISLVIPWMGYSLQDKVFRRGEPISAKVIANLFSNSYVRRVLLMDLHNDSIPGFFDIPTNYLSALNIFESYVKKSFDLKKTIIASPDFGGLKRARVFAQQLGLDLANIDKTRNLKTGKVKAVELHGNVEKKSVIILDDVIVSGGTVIEAARCLKANGAKKVTFIATHGLLTDNASERIVKSQIDQVIITNTVHHPKLPAKFKILNSAAVFAAALSKWD